MVLNIKPPVIFTPNNLQVHPCPKQINPKKSGFLPPDLQSVRAFACAPPIEIREMAAIQHGLRMDTGCRNVAYLVFNPEKSIDNRDMASPPTTPVSPKEYDIEIATIDDKEDILDFLREFFFRDEPLNKFLDLINAQSPRCLDLEYFSTKEINNGLNLKAVHNGKIIGVCLNGILKRGYLNEPEDGQKITDPKFSKIVRLLDRVAAESNIFAKFPNCDSAMTVKIITVNDAYRGQGIAKELLKKTRAIAKQKGCELMTVECSSHFTALAVKKLGFECVYRLPYAEHKENGKVVFKPEPPHDAVTVYVSKLNESCSF